MIAWLKKLLGPGDPRKGSTGSQSTQVVPVVVTMADEIRLGNDLVSLEGFRAALQRYVGQGVVLYYQREHPERPASPLAV